MGDGMVAAMGDGAVRERLQLALREALRTRDMIAASALRSALAAIDNAQAVPPGPAAAGASSPHVAGTAAGRGAGEAERRSLSEAEAERIVRAEVAERHAAARDYQRMGHAGQAGRLRHEAGVLMSAMATGEGRQASPRADQVDDSGP
jgi:uncharacterized protein YqeY